MPIIYFSYGSNMSTGRLGHRINSAVPLGVYRLPCHVLRFHKESTDGSGKCDAYFTADTNDCVQGVVYEISSTDKKKLDKIEGLGSGYTEKNVDVFGRDHRSICAFTYTALKINPLIKPYSWYMNHVLIGAREAGLSMEYIAFLASVPTINDPDTLRRDREFRIAVSGRG